ncbi:flagellar protein MotY [Aliagarivorans marinus]|uniref:flagellar protein MotY n=1 Tax=Aliagarivorans marinus TaxID=561965 RepID=UPI0004082670|nr:OmpA family protein [Aliagarivorans marinus]
MFRSLLASSLLASSMANAAIQQYSASLDDSIWVMSHASPIECRIDHIVPSFGVASFVTKASKDINLDFHLNGYRQNPNTHNVSLRSVPPSWKPGRSVSRIADLAFYKQFDGYVNEQHAWQMINELERGNEPTFYFRDWYGNGINTSVSLSTINFSPVHNEFLQCVSRLLPYSFSDIAFTVLTYRSNSNELTRRSQHRLNAILEYVKHDPDIQLVLLDAYTDSYGSRYKNQTLSESRASVVKDYFVQAGLDEDAIEVTGHGERRHVAPNSTALQRQTNRRVVISLGKELL